MKKVLASAAALSLGVIAFSATTASADPVGDPNYRQLAGMGSATTAELMQALSDVVVLDGAKAIGSYNPLPKGELVQTKSAGCTIPRADGSGDGRKALLKAMTTGDPTFGCLDFSRSSSTSVEAGQTFIQMASDGLTYVVPTGGKLSTRASLASLQAIYNCKTPAGAYTPMIPQAGSGTRGDWITYMGMTLTNNQLPGCVKDVDATGAMVQEHDARVLAAATDIAPFSVAQWIAQSSGASADTRAGAQLGAINGVTPLAQNPGQAKLRSVGNIVPSDKNVPGTAQYKVFKDDGSGKSALCTQGLATIQKYGFLPAC